MAKSDDNGLRGDPDRLGAVMVRLMLAVSNASKRKLSEQTGFDPTRIALWANGQRDPKPEELVEVARTTGIDVEWFEQTARAAIRLRVSRPKQGEAFDFAGVAEATGRKVAAIVEEALPEIEALLRAGIREATAPDGVAFHR